MKLSKVLTPDEHSSGELRLIEFLKNLPDDEILTLSEVRRAGFGDKSLVTLRAELIEIGLAVPDNLSTTIYHGNVRVIAQFKASRGIK